MYNIKLQIIVAKEKANRQMVRRCLLPSDASHQGLKEFTTSLANIRDPG